MTTYQQVKVKEQTTLCASRFVVVMINAEGQIPQVGVKANLHKTDDDDKCKFIMCDNVSLCMIMSFNQIK